MPSSRGRACEAVSLCRPPMPECAQLYAGLATGLGSQGVWLGVLVGGLNGFIVAQGEGALAHRTAYNCLQLRQRLTLCSAAEPARMPRLVS